MGIAREIANKVFQNLGDPATLITNKETLAEVLRIAFDNYRVYLDEIRQVETTDQQPDAWMSSINPHEVTPYLSVASCWYNPPIPLYRRTVGSTRTRVHDLCTELRRYFDSGTLDTASDLYLLLQEIEGMQPEEPIEQCPRSLAEEAHTLGRQQPSKLHDAGSSPAVDATSFDGCPACAGAPNTKHVPPCSAEKAASRVEPTGRPLTPQEAAVVEAFSDELTTIHRCKCGALPSTTIRGQMYCTNCGQYRKDKANRSQPEKASGEPKSGDPCPVCASGRIGQSGNFLRCGNCGWMRDPTLHTKGE